MHTRNPIMQHLFPLLILWAASGMAGAQSQPKMLGFDDNSCRVWVASKDDPAQRHEYVSWARGFLSGHNYANQKQQASDVSYGTVEMFIERFCRDKPQAEFTEAAYRMSDRYSGRGAAITK